MKKLILFATLILLVVICMSSDCYGEMEAAQWRKARDAEDGKIFRTLTVYDYGVLIHQDKGYINLENSNTYGGITIAKKLDTGEILVDKFQCTSYKLIELRQ